MHGGKRIEQLDALRGIAAVLVVLFHYTIYKHPTDAMFKFGVTGVELFFIISGFVILMTLEKTKHWRDFVVSRFARLFPGYWTCATLTAIAILTDALVRGKPVSDLFSMYLGNLTMFQHYLRMPNLDASYWTMILEMIFYIFMLGLFKLNLLHKIELIGGIILALCAAYTYNTDNPVFLLISKVIGWGIPLVHYFPLFVAGISFYRIKNHQNTIFNFCMLPVCFVVQILLFENSVRLHLHSGVVSSHFVNTTEYISILTVYFIVFGLFVANMLPVVSNRVTLFLGSISYSLYLIHQTISLRILIPFANAYLTSNYLLACAFALAVVITLATTITYLIEKPAMGYIKHKLKIKSATNKGFAIKVIERKPTSMVQEVREVSPIQSNN